MEAVFYMLAFGLTCVLMPAALRLSTVIGAIDVPDGGRKRHAHPTSRLGGLAIFAVLFVGALLSPTLADGRVAALLSGGTVLFCAGLADDVHPLPAPFKLLMQSSAAATALLTVGTPRAVRVFGQSLPLPPTVSFLLCLLLCVAMINAINFIDGLDAQAAGVVTVGLVPLSVILSARGDDGGRILCLLTVACLLAFLLYNRPPATVFMGDEGSQLLGLLAALLVLSPQEGAVRLSVLWLFAVPLGDLLLCTVGRLVRGKNPLRADRSHIHHRLLRRGFSPPAAAGLVILLSVCFAFIGYGLSAS